MENQKGILQKIVIKNTFEQRLSCLLFLSLTVINSHPNTMTSVTTTAATSITTTTTTTTTTDKEAIVANFVDVIEKVGDNDKRIYKVTCSDPCKNITAKVTASSGILHLNAREDRSPEMTVSNKTILTQ